MADRAGAILIASGPWDPIPWFDAVRAMDQARDVFVWPNLPEPDAVGYLMAWYPPAAALQGLPRLEAIFSLGAGVEHIVFNDDLPELPDVPTVRVVSSDLTRRMTEWVVLQVLLHHRQQPNYLRQQRDRRWKERRQPAAADVRVGIMGMGVLGAAAAHALVPLGFQVAGWSRRRKTHLGVESFAGPAEREAFLARTDILVCLLPLTRETRGILSMPLFESLARDGRLPGPVLINAGRGGLQIEADIVDALQRSVLAGASLDVFEREPLDSRSPLWALDNVVVTPHCAAWSNPEALTRLILDQILAHEAGRPFDNVIDADAGY
ncbi:MAG: glyoxylate/hydroxypyruvate reductase A [Hyphomicrobiales bacterium]|nr:glyoxylate/hydroxypyruvate reductase A [Hyphomicrobiales bacterium]